MAEPAAGSHERTPIELVWEIDRPGFWRWDASHSAKPTGPVLAAILEEGMPEGFKDFTARYGSALSHIELRYLNGYAYGAARIANVPEKDGPPPPRIVLKVITRLDPRWRRLERNAREAMASRVWRTDLSTWTTTTKPALTGELRALQAPLEGLSDEELAVHVEHAVELSTRACRAHFSLIGSYGLPVGDLLVFLGDHGVDAGDALTALAGRSDGTTAPRTALEAVAAAMPAGASCDSLEDIRAAAPAAADALEAYLDEFGWRLVEGLSLESRTQIEAPEAIVASVRRLRDGQRPPIDTAAVDRVRDRVPADDREAFDRLLAEAEHVYGSRDDHAGVLLWAMGLTRRAILAAGERLTTSGRLDALDQVWLLDTEELAAALRSADTPNVDLAGRAAVLAAAARTRPPTTLGRPAAPPPPGTLPPTIDRVTTALQRVADLLEREDASAALTGLGIGTARYRGRARVATDAADALATIEPGDVLVTQCTTPAFNAIFEVVGALVTSEGGPLSHPAIMARELGLPAVIGAPDALSEIRDGDEVEVDPVRGIVTVVR